MPKSSLNISVSEDEFSSILSALLFSCSINVLSNTGKEYQHKLFQLAKRIKSLKPDIKISDIQFLQEENYEEEISEELLKEFKSNIEVTSFDHM